MKAVDRVTKVIADYFEDNLDPVDVCCALDWSYSEDEEQVAWSFLVNERQDKNFSKFFEEDLNCPVCNIFIYSLFHEYGHYVTMPSFSEGEIQVYRDAVNIIESADDIDMSARDFTYYRLPVELAASRWAVEYITEHHDEIMTWYNETFLPAMKEMYAAGDKELQELINLLEEQFFYESDISA